MQTFRFFNLTWAAVAAIAICGPAGAIQFEERAFVSGIEYAGPSWGAAWGDFNDDGLPDVWTCNHGRLPSLYLNLGGGQFAEIAQSVVPPETWTFMEEADGSFDAHGAAWGDFDNDGHADLMQLASGGNRNQPSLLFHNQGGIRFDEIAVAQGLDQPSSRGRTPLWFDADGDGELDMLFTTTTASGTSPVTLYEQRTIDFEDVTAGSGLDFDEASRFAFLAQLGATAGIDLGVASTSSALRAFRFANGNFVEKTAETGLDFFDGSVDIVSGDLDGDLNNELYIVKGTVGSGVALIDEFGLDASLSLSASEQGFSFLNDGTVTFDLYPHAAVAASDIFLGAAGVHPADNEFAIAATDPDLIGIMPHTPGVDNGFYIGRDPQTGLWQVLFSTSASDDDRNIALIADQPFSEVNAIGFNPDKRPEDDLLLVRANGFYDDQAPTWGIAGTSSARNIALGDFDNDMDLDIYLVATGPVVNEPDLLYENQGDGTFVKVPDAGGTSVTTLGRGDGVAIADYDLDGFLDLLVTNGKSKPPFDGDGPYELFRNLGNANHWLQVDLEGVASNRDGIGAIVRLTAGGITQLREQSGGMHFRSQNHQRIHFGLGPNTRIDELVVEWPGGAVQTLSDIPADQILRVLEPVAPTLAGRPKFVPGFHDGVFLWKEFFDGPYELRVSGDGAAAPVYRLRLLAGEALADFKPFILPRGNGTRIYPHGFDTQITAYAREYGLSFTLAGPDRALLALERDGVANPRQLRLGADSAALTPAGWIADTSALPERPAYEAGVTLGLFAGMAGGGKVLQAHWSGDGVVHAGGVSLLASAPFANVTPLNLEAGDTLDELPGRVAFSGEISSGFKGLDALFGAAAQVGIGFEQDGLFAYRHVNPQGDSLGTPNAYWLPRAEPYLTPDYDRLTERGLFLWQTSGGQWRIRATAGTGAGTYVGELISDQPFTEVTGFNLESDDVLDTSEPTRIGFSFSLNASFQDGVNLRIAEGASLHLDVTEAVDGVDPVTTLAVGEKRWPVKNLPLDLSGW